MQTGSTPSLGWLGIVRLGLVQTALGGVVVLTNSTINRVMVVELLLPAVLPGLLVALHFAVQVLRPRWGHGADQGGRSTPWIIAGMATLSIGGFLAALATALMADNFAGGLALAIFAFLIIGLGVGAAGTSLLVLLAKQVQPDKRPAAATIVWVMMIAGFVVTAGTAGHFLDPFSLTRLVVVSGTVSLLAFILAVVAVWGVEHAPDTAMVALQAERREATPFFEALAQVWREPDARQFTIFVFVSMLAYSAQDLILEPYAGEVFKYTPGASTKLSGVQHGGVLAGMILVAINGSLLPAAWRVPLKSWVIWGCVASAIALSLIAVSGMVRLPLPFGALVFFLGICNGAFAIAAIGSMMTLASHGRSSREGVRMGLWGAAQAIAFGAGGLVGAASVDIMRFLSPTATGAYASVFLLEAIAFLVAARLAVEIGGKHRFTASDNGPRTSDMGRSMLPAGQGEH